MSYLAGVMFVHLFSGYCSLFNVKLVIEIIFEGSHGHIHGHQALSQLLKWALQDLINQLFLWRATSIAIAKLLQILSHQFHWWSCLSLSFMTLLHNFEHLAYSDLGFIGLHQHNTVDIAVQTLTESIWLLCFSNRCFNGYKGCNDRALSSCPLSLLSNSHWIGSWEQYHSKIKPLLHFQFPPSAYLHRIILK